MSGKIKRVRVIEERRDTKRRSERQAILRTRNEKRPKEHIGRRRDQRTKEAPYRVGESEAGPKGQRTRVSVANELAQLAKKPGVAWSLSLQVIEELCKYLGEGLPIQTACDLAFVPYSKFKWWHQRALEWFAGDGKDESLRMYGEFSIRTRNAMATWKRKMAKRAARKNSTFWVAPVTLLERRDRKHYGHKEPEGGTVEQLNPSELFR